MHGDKSRFWIPVGALALFTAYVGYRLVDAHLTPDVNAPDYTFTREIKGRRGSIYDCYGRSYPLVKSVSYWEYRLDPVALTNSVVRRPKEPRRTPAAIAKTIATELGIDYGRLLEMCRNGKNRYQYLAMSTDSKAHRVLADSKLVAGVAIEDRQVRQYLHGRRFSHVLGSVNAEGVGSAGLENKYNGRLSGISGKVRGMKDAFGRELYDKRIISIAPIDGADIFLTLDHNIQYETETALAAGVAEYGASAGWSVVMNARTGAILAMASLPDFDPVRYSTTKDAAKLNRVTNFTYEPGSVMKVITAAAGIDCGRVTADTLYSTRRDDPNYYRLPSDGSHVWDPYMSVRDAIVHSSNIVIGKLGVDIGPRKLWSYMQAFGFGSRTGVELPGEEVGLLPPAAKWDKVKWSRAPIGQGVSVTAIQLASAYQAIANNGVRMRPYLVSRVTASDGTELLRNEPTEIGRPIAPTTARTMRSVMVGVASPNGTARRAAIRGYSVAGKTGTAQKVVNGRYSDQLYRATFCGMVPAGDPSLVILVGLDFDERTKCHQGGNSSGPIFRRIATAALRYLAIPPDRPDELDEFDDDDEFDKIMEERARQLGVPAGTTASLRPR